MIDGRKIGLPGESYYILTEEGDRIWLEEGDGALLREESTGLTVLQPVASVLGRADIPNDEPHPHSRDSDRIGTGIEWALTGLVVAVLVNRWRRRSE